jgi:hypothetical protein
MATITIHQWSDTAAGLREMRRVTAGAVVILTFDGPAMHDYWLNQYAPEFIAAESARFPTLEDIADALGGDTRVTTVPVPLDCPDGFVEAYYGRPEAETRPDARGAANRFPLAAPNTLR